LLPEAPSYGIEYRKTWGIKTVAKTNGWSYPETHAQHEIVVGCDTYTTDEYLEMLLSTSLYNLFVQGGYFSNTLDWIRQKHAGRRHGVIIRDIFNNFFKSSNYYQTIYNRWQEILNDPKLDCTFDIDNNNIYGGYYFVALVFLDNRFRSDILEYIKEKYNIPYEIITGEQKLYVNKNNIGKTLWQGMNKISFKKTKRYNINSVISMYKLFLDTGNIMRGKKQLLGVFVK
jgi:hypothetical protein